MGAKADFSGYATVFDTVCTDGRTIKPDAFKHMDGVKVPLVWSHNHNDPELILGYALLEHRDKGIYAFGYFNDTTKGKETRLMVEHGDVEALSIFANRLKESGKNVQHGNIKEVSLVIAGANPGAQIDNVYIRHEDTSTGEQNYEIVVDEAVITSGLPLEHEDKPESEDDGRTVQEIFDGLSDEEKNVVYYMIEQAVEASPEPEETVAAAHADGDEQEAAADADGDEQDPIIVQHQEGSDMTRNLFEKNGDQSGEGSTATLSHSELKAAQEAIFADFKVTKSLKQSAEAYALQHGIENIDILFPDARTLTDRPEFIKRRTEWVEDVLGGTRHTPFSRIKTLFADITADEARAKGYIKGNYKEEEFFSVSKRVTTPTTVYKKQKLDRDDIIDITDFDVVAWLKYEIRLMLDEEIARAILIGDGRTVGDNDKIKDPVGAQEGAGIRSILNDNELFVTTVNVNIQDANSTQIELADAIIDGMQYYKGTGSPTFYTTLQRLTKMLLTRDQFGHRLWKTAGDLAAELLVSKIVAVEPMENVTDLVGIIVNLSDYNVGADKGGEINFFDDFDIDYNKYTYLMETRVSGALVKYKAAVVIKETAAANVLVAPTKPTFVESTGVVTIPTKTGVVYKNDTTKAVLTAGAQTALAPGATLPVLAEPTAGYYFKDNATDQWSFERPTA